ncbi:MAG: hypothetical protein HFF96_09910 [Oscillibacter sp.]|jgi:hypothetical protein|uniref:hypothetical protein n=1 Tax=Oscillibacter sp. TaxID=1945593 RepID=UPI00216DDB88|nr:hypothetical protein [Oscillibacter sp.]MCI9114554.1 hypothetical protein [Oscillibacter sp.]
MTNDEERAALLQRGRECCLEPFERLLEETLRESDFKRAENWYHEYSGAARMLEALGLASREELGPLREALWNRLLDAKYPGIFRKEDFRS